MLFQILAWINYQINARGAHLLHSPFVFNLYTKVIKADDTTGEPEKFRTKLLQSKQVISLTPLGAGSKTLKGEQIMLRSITNTSLLPARYAGLLYRLVKHFKPAQILEMGTSAGVTTLYLSLANERGVVHTIEGNTDMVAVADDLFSRSGRKNIRLHTGLFSDCLPEVIREMNGPDFIFIDGDHRKEPLLNYFRQLLPHVHEETVVVIDDIHWSREMDQAWQQIKQMPEVTVTIDLFRMGLVFFKKNQAKQHFTLRY
jgi:predicted O-methyltransferase YrrM